MPTLDRVLILGGTGGFGRVLCKAIAKQQSRFVRLAVLHDTSRPTSSEKQTLLDEYAAAGINVLPANGYENSESYAGFDCLIIVLGNYALHLQPAIIEAAIRGGVRHFYPSEYGADLLVGSNWQQRYYRYKVQTREFLKQKATSIPDLGWTFFICGRFAEWAAISHFGFDNRNASAKIYGTSQGRQSLIGVEDAAEYLIATLKDPLPLATENATGTRGLQRTYRISGSSPTYEDIFAALDKITGRRYRVQYLDVESAVEEEAQARKDGDVDAELSASHKLVQGREGTLVPEPWDNGRFPWIKTKAFDEVLAAQFNHPGSRRMLGLE